jgi:hypothetical protein
LLPRLVSLDGLDEHGNAVEYEGSDSGESDGEESAEAHSAEDREGMCLEGMQDCFEQYSAAAAAADDARALALAMATHPRLGAA